MILPSNRSTVSHPFPRSLRKWGGIPLLQIGGSGRKKHILHHGQRHLGARRRLGCARPIQFGGRDQPAQCKLVSGTVFRTFIQTDCSFNLFAGEAIRFVRLALGAGRHIRASNRYTFSSSCESPHRLVATRRHVTLPSSNLQDLGALLCHIEAGDRSA